MALVASVLIWAAPGSQAQTPPNIPPVAIGTLGAATPNDNGTAADPTDDYVVQALTGDRSFDPDAASGAANNGIAQFRWEVVTDTYKDWLAITNPNAANASFIVPNEASIARYGQTIEFRLTVWDANPRTEVGALSDTDTVTYNFRAAGSPTADITVTAMLPNPAAVANYDDDGDGMVDEDDEQFTIDAVISRPGEGDNADYEWHIKEGALLTIDGSGSTDPDSRLADANFTWTRVYDSSGDTGVSDNADDVDESLPGGAAAEGAGATGMKISSHTPAADGTPEALTARTVVALANTDGDEANPFFSYYRLTIDDNGATAGGNTDTADVLIVIHDQPNDPVAGTRTAPITVTVPDGPDADSDPDSAVKSALGANRYVVPPNTTVTITAMPFDADIGITGGNTGLRTSITGARVADPAGAPTVATLMIPRTAPQGTEYEVNITVTDSTMRSSTTTVTIVAARNQAPEAVAPDTITVGDGANGGDIGAFQLPTGQVMLRGIGFDADGDDLAFTWTELAYPLTTDATPALDTTGTPAAIRLPRKPYLSIDNANQETASFSVPEVDSVNLPIAQINHDGDDGTTDTINGYAIPVSFTVTDSWGVSTTGTVIVNIYDNEQYRTVANAGANQQVSSGGFVRLNGSGSSASVPRGALLYDWKYAGISTDPATEDRPALSPQEIAGGYVEGKWFPYDGLTEPTDGSDPVATTDEEGDGTNLGRGDVHPTAGGALKQATTRFPYFDAPNLHGFNSIKLTFTLTVTYDADGNGSVDTGEQQNTARVVITVSDGYYSGNIPGPDFCTGFSLGGPQTFAFDSDRDGVADICSLKTTRREAVATQNALNELAALFPDTFKDHLHGKTVEDDDTTADVDESLQSIASQCASAPDDLGDTDAALNADACGPAGSFTRRVSSPPAPVDPAVAAEFFSGVITGPDFCTNLSLGGQPLYANDSDGDGVADQCSLGYTRREAVARQNALQLGFLGHDQFAAALARACAELGTTDFGDSAAGLAADRCSNPRAVTPGTALPTANN
ncbi:MAG: hypothetical protein OXF99_07810 [bacterium]|nr:hypothetical protein [bacterium]